MVVFSPARLLNQFPKQRFTTSVWPSVCGWYALRNSSIVPNFFHQVLQKWAKNWPVRRHSLWYPMQPNNLLRNWYAMWIALEVFLQGITWAILENRSTTTKIESLPSPVLGKPCTKSMLISVQGATGTGKGVYSPVFCVCPFDSWHTLHLESAGSSPARDKAFWKNFLNRESCNFSNSRYNAF